MQIATFLKMHEFVSGLIIFEHKVPLRVIGKAADLNTFNRRHVIMSLRLWISVFKTLCNRLSIFCHY